MSQVLLWEIYIDALYQYLFAGWRTGFWILRGTEFFLCHDFQSGSGVNPTLFRLVFGFLLPGKRCQRKRLTVTYIACSAYDLSSRSPSLFITWYLTKHRYKHGLLVFMKIQVTQEPVFNPSSSQLVSVNIFMKHLFQSNVNTAVYSHSSHLHNLR